MNPGRILLAIGIILCAMAVAAEAQQSIRFEGLVGYGWPFQHTRFDIVKVYDEEGNVVTTSRISPAEPHTWGSSVTWYGGQPHTFRIVAYKGESLSFCAKYAWWDGEPVVEKNLEFPCRAE